MQLRALTQASPVSGLGLPPIVLALLLNACGSGSAGGSAGMGNGASTPVATGMPSATSTDTPPVSTGSPPGTPGQPPGDVARRLSRTELNNTIQDLLGDTSAPASRFLAEDEYTPFDNDSGRQQASSALIETLEALATDVSKKVLADSALRSRLVPCAASGVADTGCFSQVVKALGQRAFRRPFADTEVAQYLPLLTLVQNEGQAVGATFDTAVELAVRSFIQDPEFLYRIEIGSPTAAGAQLTSYETATRLSYLLLGTMPDAALFAKAQAGELLTPASRESEALRLLSEPRARNQWYRFHAMWLGYRSIPQAQALATSMSEESNHLIDRAAFDKGSYLTLFQSNETYLDTTLATHYALPAPSVATGAWVQYPTDSNRAGILSQGSVLSGFSKFSDTSPTQRGILVRTRLMCEDIPPPPAVVDVDKAPMSATSNCKIDRYAAHRETPSCAQCHEGMDLIGFGLENFDMAGRYRDHDDGHPECAISGQGSVPVLGAFKGPKELSEKLIAARKIEACMVQHFNAFASGRTRRPDDATVLAPLVERFAQSGYSFQDLVLGYVGSAEFVVKKAVAP